MIRILLVGEPVVAVAAKSRYVAEDALELITVEYETLEANTDARKAADGSAPLLFEEKGTNTIFERVFTWGEVDAAFAAADRVVTESYRWHRLGANPLETFGCISQWDPIENALTCWGSFQSQYRSGPRRRPRPADQQDPHHQSAARRQLRWQGRVSRS